MSLDDLLSKVRLVLRTELKCDPKEQDIASALGLSKAHLAKLKKTGTIPYKNVIYFGGQKKININWLFFDQDIDSIADNSERIIKIRYFPHIYASCGGGAYNEDEDEKSFIYLDKEIALALNINSKEPDRYEAIKIVGDSMEPLYKDGGIAVLDVLRRDVKGDVCAVVTTGGLFIKKVVMSVKGTIDLISLNTLYPKESFNANDVTILGRVVGSI
jgi:hypothetical protein